jgi:hypothetical protein
MIFLNHKKHKRRSQRDTKVENVNWVREDMHKKDPLLGEPVPLQREARGGLNNKKNPISDQNKQRQVFIILLFLLFPSSACFCQEEKYPEMIVNIAEELAAEDDDPEAAEIYIEYLNELTENPVMVNSMDETELSRLFFLSDFQIRSLADHIRRTGNIVSVYEIAAIPGFDQRIAEMMMPFISLKENTKNSSDTLSVRSTLITNLIFKPGEKDTSSLGSQLKILTKYRISAGKFSAGFTTEKDAGERYFTGSPPRPEFLSAYSSYSGKGIIRKLIFGDFSLRFGAGTCINNSLRTGLRLTAPGFMTGRDNLRPYTSTDENNFFRGTAADLCVKNAELILFYSRNRIDATPELSSDSAILFISSIYKTGLHNTSSLLLKKDLLRETVYGFSLSYNFKFMRVGANWSETGFSIPLHRNEGDPESIYDFEGAKNRLLSVNYNTLAGRILLYGEFSVNNSRNSALVNGVTLRPSDRLTINVLWRKYSSGFAALNGKGPGNSSSSANEEGITGNFSFEAAKHLFISAGCDVSHYPWLKYRCSFPSMSRKEEILIRYLPSEKLSLEFSFDHRYSMINDQKNQGVAGIEVSESRSFKWLFRYLPAENSAFTTRIDYKMAYPVRSRGMLLFEDINYRFKMIPVTLWFRYCLFSTESWDSRLYTYENDLLYSFSIPALSGEGSRSYLMAKFDLGHFGEMRIKYGLTSIIEKRGTESFNDELKLQFRIWF